MEIDWQGRHHFLPKIHLQKNELERAARFLLRELEGGGVSEALNYELAERDYVDGMKYKEIAEKYGVSINTVKSWKTRHSWNKKGVHTKTQKVCTQKTGEIEVVQKVSENNDLTDKQQLFCVCFVKSFNATKAYQKAYQCSYNTAMTEGCKTLRNPKIKEEIKRIKQARLNQAYLSEEDVFQKYMDIAFADITDYVSFGQKEIPVYGKNGPTTRTNQDTGETEEVTCMINTVDFKESSDVDGTLISEVKKGKDGASIKLADKMKALEWIANHMKFATEEQKARIEQMKANTERLKRDDDIDDEEGVTIINDAPRG